MAGIPGSCLADPPASRAVSRAPREPRSGFRDMYRLARRLIPKVLLVSLLWMPSSASIAAQLVVIASTSGEYPLGAIVDGRQTLSLSAGEVVTLVASDGRSVNLVGPYEGQPAATDEEEEGELLESLSELLRDPKTRSSLAVFRAAPGAAAKMWSVPVEREGVHCVPGGQPVKLRRRKVYETVALRVGREGAGESSVQQWAKGERTVPWPADVPVVDKGVYTLELGEGSQASRIQLHVVPANLGTDAHRASWMAERGCTSQSLTLLQQLGR